MYDERLMPAFLRYRDFLEREYLPAARSDIALLANPQGPECYAALVRLYSSQRVSARDVHEQGLRQIEMLDGEMKTIAERTFGTSDVRVLLQRVRDDPRYRFKSREELIGYSARALERARSQVGRWFGRVPGAAVRQPYPAFARRTHRMNTIRLPKMAAGPASSSSACDRRAERSPPSPRVPRDHSGPSPNGHRPRGEEHPPYRALHREQWFSEGWALHRAARGRCSSIPPDLDRLGMLSSRLRAARLVVDSGIHTLGWSRQRAIDYLLAHTTEAPDDMTAEVDRYIIWPGQATAYMLGFLEIQKAREDARRSLGARFDIKSFHDRLLEDGAVPMTFLTAKMKRWARDFSLAGGGPS